MPTCDAMGWGPLKHRLRALFSVLTTLLLRSVYPYFTKNDQQLLLLVLELIVTIVVAVSIILVDRCRQIQDSAGIGELVSACTPFDSA